MSSYVDRLNAQENDPIWEQLEGDNPCKDTTVYTASRLFSIGSCKWAFYLEHVAQVQPETRNIQGVRGTSVHKAIHRLHKTQKWNDWGDIFKECWHDTLNDPEEVNIPFNKEWTEEKILDIARDGARMVRGYAERNHNAPVIASEVPFRMLLENPKTKTRYRFSGTMDQLRGSQKDGLEIFDLKTEAAEPSTPYLARNLQFSAYGLALKDGYLLIDEEPVNFGQYPVRNTWYQLMNLVPYKRATTKKGVKYQKDDLRGSPVMPVHRTAQDYEFFRAEAMKMIQVVRFKLFFREPDKVGCTMCKMAKACTTSEATYREDAVETAELEGI